MWKFWRSTWHTWQHIIVGKYCEVTFVSSVESVMVTGVSSEESVMVTGVSSVESAMMTCDTLTGLLKLF